MSDFGVLNGDVNNGDDTMATEALEGVAKDADVGTKAEENGFGDTDVPYPTKVNGNEEYDITFLRWQNCGILKWRKVLRLGLVNEEEYILQYIYFQLGLVKTFDVSGIHLTLLIKEYI